jgi:ribosomal protein L21E
MVYARKPSSLFEVPEIEHASEFVARISEARKAIEASARKQLIKEIAKRKRAYYKNHRTHVEPIAVGDQVMISSEATHVDSSKKLEPKFQGPYNVVQVNKQDVVVESEDQSYNKAIHLSRVHRYLPSTAGRDSSPKSPPIVPKPTPPRNSNSKAPPAEPTNAPPTYTTRAGRQIRKVVRFS